MSLLWTLIWLEKVIISTYSWMSQHPLTVQLSLVAIVILTGLLVYFMGRAFHTQFMAVPENWLWVGTVHVMTCTNNVGQVLARSLVGAGKGLAHFAQHMCSALYGLAQFVYCAIRLVCTATVWPFLLVISALGTFCSVAYGIVWAVRDPDRMFESLDPSHNLKFRRAAGLSTIVEEMHSDTVHAMASEPEQPRLSGRRSTRAGASGARKRRDFSMEDF